MLTLILFLGAVAFAEMKPDDPAVGLKVGAVAPQISQTDVTGKKFSLADQVKSGPVVIVFYRGGWCPHCNLQLKRLERKVAKAVSSKKGVMIAVSVDLPDEGKKSVVTNDLSFRVFADPSAKLLKSYQVPFKVPDKLVSLYKNSYKIDLEKSSGEKHHIIAVPAVFVVNRDQKIVYRYANKDYKVRAPEDDIVASLNKW